jgi:hypothetical protein
MRRNHHDETPIDAQPFERLVHELAAPHTDRSEGNELVLVAAGGDHPSQGSENVVADAGSRVRERRHVVRDSHGAL